MTRLEKYGIPAALGANLVARLIASRRTTADFNPSSLFVILGGIAIAVLAATIVFLEQRRPRTTAVAEWHDL
jgi:hypothetical protein